MNFIKTPSDFENMGAEDKSIAMETYQIINDPETDPSILAKLFDKQDGSGSEGWDIREAISRNPNAPVEILKKLEKLGEDVIAVNAIIQLRERGSIKVTSKNADKINQAIIAGVIHIEGSSSEGTEIEMKNIFPRSQSGRELVDILREDAIEEKSELIYLGGKYHTELELYDMAANTSDQLLLADLAEVQGRAAFDIRLAVISNSDTTMDTLKKMEQVPVEGTSHVLKKEIEKREDRQSFYQEKPRTVSDFINWMTTLTKDTAMSADQKASMYLSHEFTPESIDLKFKKHGDNNVGATIDGVPIRKVKDKLSAVKEEIASKIIAASAISVNAPMKHMEEAFYRIEQAQKGVEKYIVVDQENIERIGLLLDGDHWDVENINKGSLPKLGTLIMIDDIRDLSRKGGRQKKSYEEEALDTVQEYKKGTVEVSEDNQVEITEAITNKDIVIDGLGEIDRNNPNIKTIDYDLAIKEGIEISLEDVTVKTKAGIDLVSKIGKNAIHEEKTELSQKKAEKKKVEKKKEQSRGRKP